MITHPIPLFYISVPTHLALRAGWVMQGQSIGHIWPTGLEFRRDCINAGVSRAATATTSPSTKFLALLARWYSSTLEIWLMGLEIWWLNERHQHELPWLGAMANKATSCYTTKEPLWSDDMVLQPGASLETRSWVSLFFVMQISWTYFSTFTMILNWFEGRVKGGVWRFINSRISPIWEAWHCHDITKKGLWAMWSVTSSLAYEFFVCCLGAPTRKLEVIVYCKIMCICDLGTVFIVKDDLSVWRGEREDCGMMKLIF